MSATLPSFLQTWLTEAVHFAQGPVRASDDEFKLFQRHRLEVKSGDMLDPPHLSEIAKRARHGSVLVVCNTVRRAQRAYEELRRIGVQPELLHSRFTAQDRLRKEDQLRPGEEQGGVMVATQVVEVSLNISFSTVFTDPAPLEALFQRFGRVNRYRQADTLAPVHVFTEPLDTRVYNRKLVKAAVVVLLRHSGEAIDEARLTGWLDEQYTPEVLGPIETEYTQALNAIRHKLARLAPFQSDPTFRDEFFEMFDAVEVLPASLDNEYEALLAAGEMIEASSLLVPIRWRQWEQLKRAGRTRELLPDHLRIVEVPYDAERGLRL